MLSQNPHQFITRSYSSIVPTPEDFIYLDPPYLASGFRYSGLTKQDEPDLLTWIDQLPCSWALSNTLKGGKRVNTILDTWSKNKTVI
jgi:site-specific DNA-adenine methylase